MPSDALLQEAGVVHDQHRTGITEVLDDVVAIEAMLAARPRTYADRRAARTAGGRDLRRVVQHLHAHGDDAIDLYGADLTTPNLAIRAGAYVETCIHCR